MKRIQPVYAGLALAALAVVAGMVSGRADGAGSPGAVQSATAERAGERHEALEGFWKAVAASGTVETMGPSAGRAPWAAVKRGDRLLPMSRVRTHERSRATLTRLGDIILVHPETSITLPPGEAGSGRIIRQDAGSALYEIEPSPRARVRVVTPYLVAGVKGTVFSIVVDPGSASVSVISGAVQVRITSTGRVVDLLAGDMAVFHEEGEELEVYREPREEGRQPVAEVSDGALRSLKTTRLLLDEASASLTDESQVEDSWKELRDLDLSLWNEDRSLLRESLDDTLDDDGTLQTIEDDLKDTFLGLKRR